MRSPSFMIRQSGNAEDSGATLEGGSRVCSDRLQSLPRVSLGRALTLPRGTVGLRRKPKTPPLGTFSTAQDSRFSRIYLMGPSRFLADGSSP